MYGQGRVTFTLAEASRSRSASLNSTLSALARAQRDSLLLSPLRGFYVIVPPEYRHDGAPPWRWFIGPMLQFLQAPYYVGLLTAAVQHGASAQAPQEVQIVVDRQIRQKVAGRQRIQFVLRKRASLAPVVEVTTPTGALRVSTPEMTMLDLVAYPSRAAGWDNVASLIPDLAPLGTRRGWRDALRVGPRATEVQRLGHLLDRIDSPHTDVLAEWLDRRPHELTPLVPRSAAAGERDPRWRVIVNALVEPD